MNVNQLDSSMNSFQRQGGVRETSKERKTSKKAVKKKETFVDYTGPYFNHSNFERAVIATNGRAPYNNKEVELITQPDGFDPNSYNFKKNWVNNLMKSGGKKSHSPNHHQYGSTARFAANNDRVPSAAQASAQANSINMGQNLNDSFSKIPPMS